MRVCRLVAGVLAAGLVAGGAYAEEPGTGRLLGVVTGAADARLDTLLVTAAGPAGAAVAACGADGRFEFRGLAPGFYLLRAHAAGFTAGAGRIVEVRSGLSTLHSMRLRRIVPAAGASPAVLAASAASGLGGASGAQRTAGAARDGEDGEGRGDGEAAGERTSGAPPPHDHTPRAWRLRRARRSVLKDAAPPVVPAADAGRRDAPADDPAARRGRPSGGLLNEFAPSGRLHLLARARVDAPGEAWSVDQMPGQIAYVDVGAPAGENGWGVRGAVAMGDRGSWVLAGSYATDVAPDHAIEVGASFSRQRPPRADDALAPGENARASDRYANREVGSVQADGSWSPSRRLSVGYGAAFAHYGYLERGGLLSPRAQVVVEPAARTRVRAAVARNLSAPGGEEFLPSASGFWLPPERTFAPLSALDPLRVERTRHVEVALERDVGSASVIGVRGYRQNVANQMITLFGVEPGIDHYYVANARSVDAAGWGVSFSHALAGRVQGAVEYNTARSRWAPWGSAGPPPSSASAARSGAERFHDVTTSIEAEIPETATSVFVLARINTAFSRAEAAAVAPGLDARFALRVTQTLPFAPFGDGDWEVLFDVRNLLRDRAAGASVYDELLVVNPPKQVVGGLVVHF